MRWASFTRTDLLLVLGAQSPPARYSLGCNAPLLTRLPQAYTTSTAWQGAKPRDLLQAYWDRQLARQGRGAPPVYERLEAGGADAGAPEAEQPPTGR